MEDLRFAIPDFTRPPFFPPTDIWVLGAGHFGHLAAKRLGRRYPEAKMLVVDRQGQKLERIRNELGVETHEADAVSLVVMNSPVDSVWLVPAVPVHLAFQWLLVLLDAGGEARPIPVPTSVDALVPNPYRMGGGTLYASFATFLCPDSCDEPAEMCTYTKKPREGNLFEVLSRIMVPGFHVTVLRSLQLAPGVGGYTAGYIRKILEGIRTSPGAHLIATSCRCHGVIDGLEWA
jgi:hypothetical protein